MIEVGEYIRTDKGKLGRVIRVWESEYKHDRTRYLVDWGNGRATYISQIKNVKHSKNIIDLIEVGDIVSVEDNLYDEVYISEVFYDYEKVLCIHNGEANKIIDLIASIDNTHIKIKSIVTKEQFKEMEYRV